MFAGDGGFLPLINYLIDDCLKTVVLYSVRGSSNGAVIKRLKHSHLWIEDEMGGCIQPITQIDQKYLNLVIAVDAKLKNFGWTYYSNSIFSRIRTGNKSFTYQAVNLNCLIN